MVSSPENYFVDHPQAEALHRLADGKYTPDLAEYILTAMVDGGSLISLQNLVMGELEYINKWKEDPEKVIKAMTKVDG